MHNDRDVPNVVRPAGVQSGFDGSARGVHTFRFLAYTFAQMAGQTWTSSIILPLFLLPFLPSGLGHPHRLNPAPGASPPLCFLGPSRSPPR
jgi:hypothetical protein